tara:strand:- start:19106 stop:19483 length:378 start_codon:yes stop_codon:yes gene_type:complete
MSFQAIIQDAVGVAFDAVDDVKVAGTLTVRDNQSYNTGTRTYPDGTPDVDSVEVIKYDFRAREIDGDRVRHGDTNIMVQLSELSSDYRAYQTFTETVSGKVWRVISFDGIPGQAAVIYQLRLQDG